MKGKIMNQIKRILTNLSLAVLMAVSIAGLGFTAVQPIHAQTGNTSKACEGVALTGGSCDAAGGEAGVQRVVETIIDVLSIIVGVISVIMIIIGGLRFILSGGDSSSTAAARNTIIYAIVGLVIVIFAQVIISFVVGRLDETATSEEDTTMITPLRIFG